MTAQEEAKQLDSVTDRVQDKEFDASVAQSAMSALTNSEAASQVQASTKAVSKEDVELIVKELEVSEEEAERVLREVQEEDGKSAVFLALKKLVTAK